MLCFCGFVIIYTFKLWWGFGIFVSADSFVGCVGLFSWEFLFSGFMFAVMRCGQFGGCFEGWWVGYFCRV